MKKQSTTRNASASQQDRRTSPASAGKTKEQSISTDSRKKDVHREKRLGDENEINDDTTI
ncbi:hypothetical protein [Ohtaekwangia sp.]|uniref:hypothetical protein n=1 Tax=Ohtaekwangia sp. TaxID=2066019 RepID=UPI002F935D55